METPAVSVIVPTYNRPEYLKKALASILSQTFTNFEVVVVDDGVEERAQSVVEEVKDFRVRYIKHESNRGAAAARNTGAREAKGNYIAFLDDDDEWEVSKLKIQYEIAEKYKKTIGFTFCAIDLFREDTEKTTTQLFRKEGIHNFYEDLLDHRIRILTSSLFIKKEVFHSVGGFDESFPSSQEWELLIRVSKEHDGYALNKVLVHMKFLSGWHIGGDLARRIKGRERLVAKHKEALSLRPQVLSRHYFQLGIFCRDNKEYQKARSYFYLSWKKNPFYVRSLAHFVVLMFKGK